MTNQDNQNKADNSKRKETKTIEDIQDGKKSSRNGYGDRDPEDIQD